MTIVFGFLAGMMLVCALGVVLSRNVVHSALFMSGSFLAVAGFFAMLSAPALAAFQILIYVGAVTVVILFGIMFTQKPQVRRFSTIMNGQVWAGLIIALGVGGLLSVVLVAEDWGDTAAGQGTRSVPEFANALLGVAPGTGIFTLLFEVASVLLLVAVVAAIIISRRKPGEGEDVRPDREQPEGIGGAERGVGSGS